MQLIILVFLVGFSTVTSMTVKEQIDWFELDPKGMYG